MGERERVATLSHPVGSKEAERPMSVSSETVSPKGQPASSKTNISARTAPESSRGCEPSRLPIEAGDLRGGKIACPKGKQAASRPTKRNRRFRLVAPGADFFGAGACPPEKKSLPCRFRARKSEGFQRNLRKGGAEGNLSPPPRESSRGPQSSRISIKSISAGNHILFRGVAVAGELAPPSTSRFAFIR